jgi:hypothetical protein
MQVPSAVIFPIPEDDMPLNEADRSWIRETIQDAHKAHGWGGVRRFIKEWSGMGAAVAILILAFTQYTGYVEFRTHTNDTLTSIDSRLTKIEAQSAKTSEYVDNAVKAAKEEIRNKADLPQNSFNQKLPSVADALRSATHQGIRLDPGALKTINEKLERSPQDRPGYWPATGALVSAQSVTEKSEYSLSKARSLPDCPIPSGGPNFVGLHREISDCAIVLDGWRYTNSIFTDVVVKYRGGHLELQNTRFVNCIFIIELPANPPPAAKTFARQLLAEADYKDILINRA